MPAVYQILLMLLAVGIILLLASDLSVATWVVGVVVMQLLDAYYPMSPVFSFLALSTLCLLVVAALLLAAIPELPETDESQEKTP